MHFFFKERTQRFKLKSLDDRIRDLKKKKKKVCQSAPRTELNPVSQFVELIRKSPLLDDALWSDGHLTQGVRLGPGGQAELPDRQVGRLSRRRVPVDQQVAALLICLEHPQHLILQL